MVRFALPLRFEYSPFSGFLGPLFVIAGVAGCGDLKSAGPDGPNDTAADGGTGTTPTTGGDHPKEGLPGNLGPGPFGALPTGYCCSDDSECRNRHCVAVAGTKMCLDVCSVDSTCTRRDLAFKCDSPSQFEDGLCQPPTPTFTCIPQARFERGSRKVGECCAATGDGNSGEECDGNSCIAKGINGDIGPFVCSHWCELTKDCPSGTVCSPFKSCEPANFPYVCK